MHKQVLAIKIFEKSDYIEAHIVPSAVKKYERNDSRTFDF